MKPLLFLLILLCLTGCDRYYGVVRNTEIDYVVDHRCVKEALESIDVITDVSYKFQEGGKPLTLTGLKEPDKVHYYFYRTPEINGCIYLKTNYLGNSEISQSYGDLNHIPSQAEIDKIRPLMDRIQKAVGKCCGIKNMQEITKETCSGVKCEPLQTP